MARAGAAVTGGGKGRFRCSPRSALSFPQDEERRGPWRGSRPPAPATHGPLGRRGVPEPYSDSSI